MSDRNGGRGRSAASSREFGMATKRHEEARKATGESFSGESDRGFRGGREAGAEAMNGRPTANARALPRMWDSTVATARGWAGGIC